MGKLGVGFCAGFAVAAVWLVALGCGAGGLEAQVDCQLATIHTIHENVALVTAGEALRLVHRIDECRKLALESVEPTAEPVPRLADAGP